MQHDRIKKLKLAARQDEIEREMERYELFIAGPYIDKSKERSDPDNSSSEGKCIRFDVFKYYEEKWHNIYLGEDVELRKIGSSHYGSSSNAVFFERHYITKNIDVLIVFPDGPGVFCEFGDWASTPSTCQKMLVIINKKYEGKSSYINDGTAKAAKHFGAAIVYETYTDFGAVIARCDNFIDIRASSARVEKLYGR
ncbi:hypothetical protein F4V91_16405 [Neorhizobium galegae]|uniref:Nucleoside 2-deoxyribosyltransferase n=1 Tax=Neorhizobium galegae TaxID=399 RepID=A0A6A1TTI1_NEOGA|nr:hypothetical protein [Neorhizobium galegae]KAB1087872.1 hypothetical protein F4V91_16405 [Neorhizobium galegae]